ncbi:MAG: hypothetical protein Q4A75_06560 [Peptostreptococcaceae bacterium]|nr:hypothetical protein [Peptostreptococcaceae bacterium]
MVLLKDPYFWIALPFWSKELGSYNAAMLRFFYVPIDAIALLGNKNY